MNSLIKTLYLCDYHYPYFDHLNLKKADEKICYIAEYR